MHANRSLTRDFYCSSERGARFRGSEPLYARLSPRDRDNSGALPLTDRDCAIESCGLSTKHRVVTCGSHKEEHGKRKHEVCPRQKRDLTGQIFCTLRHRSAIRGVVPSPKNNSLLPSPDHAPDVQHHDPAHTASNSNRQQAVAFPTVIVETQEQVRGEPEEHDVGEGQYRS